MDLLVRGCPLQARRARIPGVRLHRRTLGDTVAQAAKAHGASIGPVSGPIRHKDSKTTERYCARMQPVRALNELREKCAPEVAQITFSPG